jgi:hypothetical protein
MSLALTAGVVLSLGLVASGSAAIKEAKRHPRVLTDGRLRPGHLETIRVVGFPGKGDTQISFFPGAICEDACGARTFAGDRTDSKGAARFRVRMPGTFLDSRNRPVYFRDRERINVTMTWEGKDESFDVATADPEPIVVRTHGGRHG